MWFLPSPHPELVNLVTTWASPNPGDFVPHLDLIAVDSFWASPGTGDSDPNWAHPDLVTLSSPVDHYDLDTLFHT